MREIVLLLQLSALAYLTVGAGCKVGIICLYLVVMSKKLLAVEICICGKASSDQVL